MYCGRFAPTPSGELHLGSVLTAVGAYLRAKSEHGLIGLRIEDLDPARCREQSVSSILGDLRLLGLRFDGRTVYQSRRTGFYRETLARLVNSGQAYYCSCTRHSLRLGPCRCHLRQDALPRGGAVRFKPRERAPAFFIDERLGRLEPEPEGTPLTLRRGDGIFAYNLACVADDAAEGVTEVVRGADLIAVTPPQLALFRALGARAPKFLHLPLVTGSDGRKLSKQNRAARALSLGSPREILFRALALLGQDVSYYRADLDPQSVLREAVRRFSLAATGRSLRAPGGP